uniref:ZP domain-containing protein n=1 Tax=Heterorhabditis bacteriophora TaxID=37862 RepID=A0A1I7X3E3_HETBA
MALRNSLGPMDEREGDWETRDPCGPVIMSHCTTRMDTRQFRNKWVIDQFSVQQELLQTGEYISSSSIVKCPQPKLQFRVNFTVETPEGPRGCALNKNVVTINRGGIVTASKFFSTESLRVSNIFVKYVCLFQTDCF